VEEVLQDTEMVVVVLVEVDLELLLVGKDHLVGFLLRSFTK
jgi:hypothetical protein